MSQNEQASPEAVDAPKPRRKRLLFLAAGILGAVFVLALIGLRLYFSDAYFKELLETSLRDALNGRPATIASLELNLLSGRVKLKDLRVQQTDPAFKDKELFSFADAEIECGLWSLLTSGGKRIEALVVEVQKPVLALERRMVGQAVQTNIDDLIKRYTGGEWPMRTGLEGMSAKLRLLDGIINIRDSTPGKQDFSLEDVRFDADLPALGQSLQSDLKFLLKTPDVQKGGQADLKAQMVAIDEQGVVDPDLVKDISLNATLDTFDYAHLARYADVRFQLVEDKYDGTPGKPISGTVEVKAPSMKQGQLSALLDTDGILAVWSKDKRVADNLPTKVEIDAELNMEKDQPIGPVKTRILVAGNRADLEKPDSPKCLKIAATASAPGEEGQDIEVDIKGVLDQVFATDVGKTLALGDRLGDIVDGKLKLNLAANRSAKLDARLKVDSTKGPQSVPPIDMAITGNVDRNAEGAWTAAHLNVQVKGPGAEVKSRKPIKLSSLDDLNKLNAEADLDLSLRGKEIWKTFGFLLAPAGFVKPIEEQVVGTLKITGTAGKANAVLAGRITREGKDAQPMQIDLKADYDAEAIAAGSSPYLVFAFQMKSESDTSLNVTLDGKATRKKASEAGALQQFMADLDHLNVQALITRAVVHRLQNMGLVPNEPLFAGDLRLKAMYAGTTGKLDIKQLFLKGENVDLSLLVQQADVKQALAMKPDAKWTDRIKLLPALALRAHGKEPAIRRLQALKVLTDHKALLGDWDLNASYDPKTGSLNVGRVHFESAAGNVTIMAPAISAKNVAAFLDAGDAPDAASHLLADCTLRVEAKPKLFDDLRKLPNFPDDLPVTGDISMNMRYQREPDRLFMDLFRFQSREGSESPLTALEMTFEVAKVSKLLQEQAQEAVAYLPHLDKGFYLKTVKVLPEKAFAYLKKQGSIKGLLADTPLDGPVEIAGQYETKGDRLVLQRFNYDRRAGSKAPVIALELMGSVVGLQKLMKKFPEDLPGYLDHVGDLLAIKRLKVAPEIVFAHLKAMKLNIPLPNESPLEGTCEIRARYDHTKDRVTFETVEYKRAQGSKAPLIDLALNLEVARIRDLLKNTPKSAAEILPNLDKGLFLPLLSIATTDAIAWAKRNGYKSPYLEQVHPKGTYRPLGAFIVKDLRVMPPDLPDGYKVSFLAQTPVAVHQASGPGKPLSDKPMSIISGPWGFSAKSPLELLPAPDRLIFQGKLRLDDALLYCAAGKPYFVYEKKPGTTSHVAIKGAMARNGATTIDRVSLSGGPLAFAAKKISVGAGPKTVASMSSFQMTEGPMKVDLKDVLYDQAKDRLRVTADLKTLDVADARRYASLPPTLSASGTLENCVVSYDGRQSVLASRAFGPKDAFSLKALAKDIQVIAKQGERAYAVSINGGLIADNNRVSSKALSLGVGRQYGAQTSISQKLMLRLDIAPRTAGTPLLAGLTGEGMPITVKAPVRATTPVNIDLILAAMEAVTAGAPAKQPVAKTGGGLEAIRKLRVESSLSAPEVSYGGYTLTDLQIPSVVLSDGRLTIPSVKGSGFQGSIQLGKAAYQLLVDPIQHTQTFALKSLDLRRLTVGPKGKDETKIFGGLTATGGLAGAGFTGMQRRSWSGQIAIAISNLVIKNSPKSGFGNVMLDTFKNFGLDMAGDFFGLGGSGRMKYFNEFLKELAFKPFEVSSEIKQGRLRIPQTQLVGTGPSEGFVADVHGGVDLATELFNPPLQIRILKLSPVLQKAFSLEQLDEADRNTILTEFAQGKFTPLVIDGKSSDPNYIQKNNIKFLNELRALQSRVNRLIEEKRRRERQAQRQKEGDTGTGTKQPQSGQGKTGGETSGDTPPKKKKKKKKKKKRSWEEIIGVIPDILKGGDK